MAKRKTVKSEDYGDFFENLEVLAKDKGIDIAILTEKIKYAIEKSLMSNLHFDAEIEFEKRKAEPDEEKLNPEHYVCVDFDMEKRNFSVYVLKEVIEEIDNLYEPDKEIVLEEARKIDPKLEVGDHVRIPIDTKMFKRIAAKNAKDLIRQGFSTAERQRLSEIWGQYQDEAVSAVVTRVDPKTGFATLEIDHNEVNLPRNEQIPGETLEVGQVIKVYISGVSKEFKEGEKNQTLKISRNDKWLIKRLFELECPEIQDGTVEIMAVSRAPGSRSKIAVWSKDENVDPLGACIGPQKSRINAVTKEIKGEKVDVVLYSEEPEEFIKQALKPAEVSRVVITNPNPDKRECKAVVPDNQLSLAIGNKGQNAWLAAKLTGYKIDIKAESAVTDEDFEIVPLDPKYLNTEEDEAAEGEAETSAEAAQEIEESANAE
ncbi:MAG: transcription termination factor NusA [Oscillospiraceae bacterium]|nr:transcription termination factor NusA [Oscillospiraceae bacterium]